MKIIGIDYSGAKSDRNTWLTEGVLGSNNRLELTEPRRIGRNDLACTLASLSGPVVVAMDFPFSVPAEFARFWRGDDVINHGWGMPDLWTSVAEMELDDFTKLGSDFVSKYGEPKRVCDPPESFSCLHNTRPNMVPMTFWGMQLLNLLYNSDAHPVEVLPLPPQSDPKPQTVLMEVMPGAVLNRLGLPFTGYKSGRGQEQREQRRQVRGRIVERLPERIDQMEVDLTAASDRCVSNPGGDALDSVVAAIAAALWCQDPDAFHQPPIQDEPGYQQALLEGWLYDLKGCCRCCDV